MIRLRKIIFFILAASALLSACQIGQKKNSQEEINEYLRRGEAAYKEGHYDEAIAAYDQVLAIEQNYDDAYIYRAKSQVKLKQIDAAVSDLSRVRAMPKPAAFYEVDAEVKVLQRKPDDALLAIDQALSLEPTRTRAGIKGIVQFQLHKQAEARQLLTDGLGDATDDEKREYLYLLAELAIQEQNYPEATKRIAEHKKLGGAEAKLGAMQGYVYLKEREDETDRHERKRLTEAAESERKLALVQADVLEVAVAQNYLGLMDYVEDDYEAAQKHFERAITLEPDYAAFYNNKALVSYAAGDFDSAYEEVSQAIKLDGREPEFYLGRGYILMYRRQDDAALGNFAKAVDLDEKYRERVPDEQRRKLPEPKQTEQKQIEHKQ